MIHYIIARRDLDPDRVVNRDWLPPPNGISTLGITAAQITHAAGESFADFVRNACPKPPDGWRCTREPGHDGPCAAVPIVPRTTIAVVLGVPNQRALLRVEKRLLDAGIRHVAVREPDAPWNGQLMTIGLWPIEDRWSAVDRYRRPILSRLKLL